MKTVARKKVPLPTDVHVGSRVRERRAALNYSQTKLADALGLTFQQVQKYEKGTNRIGASRLQQIAQFLRVPATFFFDGGPSVPSRAKRQTSPSTDYVSDFLADPDGLTLIKEFIQIKDAKLRRKIVQLVEQIADG
jgi:transcriptional regulator with XRE-family HTH domain